MDLTAEIKSKEKSLSDLMVKILKGPLNPIEDSLKTLKDDLLDTKDLVSEVNDAVNVSVGDLEKVQKTLKRIREDSLPEIASSIQTVIAGHVGSQSQHIIAKLTELSSSLGQEVGAARAEQAHLIQAAIAEVRLNRENAENADVDRSGQLQSLALELKQAIVEIGTVLEDLHRKSDSASSEGFRNLTQESCRVAHELSASLERCQTVMMEAMDQQRRAMLEEFSSLKAKMKISAIIIGVFFASMLAYVGYDLSGKF
ncbi:hypothetical protein [Achromobacter sp. JUb104]|uniref:hypothetical protein n=1 Tax=Achromobacter sp. JUb104 TaxID=2940590 RepID=UPI0021674ACF|nr:hypothetical protein [Achromobacter sp. JUb104]MCS3507473.1 hypothetical protein [Achromobacter sp. JUb104]